MATNRLLQGVVRLNSADDNLFIMNLSDNPSGIQNQIAPVTVDEVFIECNTTTAGITILLPQIAEFNGGWSPKIFVTIPAGENSVTVLSYNDETPNSDFINGIGSVQNTQLNSTVYLHITEKNNWGAWLSCAELIPPPPIV
jgi:hypothetical protein